MNTTFLEHTAALVHDTDLQYKAELLGLNQPFLRAVKTVAETDIKAVLLEVLVDQPAESKGADSLSSLTTHWRQI